MSLRRTGALKARLVRLVQPAKVETVQVLFVFYTVHLQMSILLVYKLYTCSPFESSLHVSRL